jgi:hypothetical protein
VADCLRKNVKSLSIPVVYPTARNSDADRQRAATLGAAGVSTESRPLAHWGAGCGHVRFVVFASERLTHGSR